MERWNFVVVSLLLWISLVVLRFELCVSVNENGKDAYVSSNLNEKYTDSCDWHGAGCSNDGIVESLNGKRITLRRLLQSSTPEQSPFPDPTHPTDASPSASNRKLSSSLIAAISIGATICVLVLVSIAYVLWHQTKKDVTVIPWPTGLSGKLQKAFVTGIPSLRRSELEVACEDFSNIIGSLSNCSLYKGTLSNGVEIAVTSIDTLIIENWSEQYETQYWNKLSVLSRVNHKNFKNLIGYCEEEEPFTRMMVFEYTPNGTLFEHLHIKEAEPLEWTARLRIAMGIVYCLEHIAMLSPPVTLKNLNSSCIYLTDDFAAKISDLDGWTVEQKDLQPGSSNQDNIVYKFGIILLEIISGRRPFSEDDGLLVLWASSYLDGKRPLMDMVDQSLTSVTEQTIVALTNIIRSCVREDMKEIPTIEDVVSQMKQITSITPDQAYPRLTPTWWSEIEIITQ